MCTTVVVPLALSRLSSAACWKCGDKQAKHGQITIGFMESFLESNKYYLECIVYATADYCFNPANFYSVCKYQVHFDSPFCDPFKSDSLCLSLCICLTRV